MRLRWLRIQGFRSFVDETIEFDRRFTTLVGNNTGKSAIALAIQKCATQLVSGGNQIGPEDYPYGQAGPLCIELGIELEHEDVTDLFDRRWPSLALDPKQLSSLRERSPPQGEEVVVGLYRSAVGSDTSATVRWGQLAFVPNEVSRLAQNLPQRMGISPEHYRSSQPEVLATGFNPGVQIGQRLFEAFKPLAEFRVRAERGQLSGAMEAPTGSETASVLLNLKDHQQPRERERYRQIVETFRQMFSRYHPIEAVRSEPGASAPEVQFREVGQSAPLSLGAVSAGVHQILGMIVNVVGRDGLILFCEHPEQHLHPHGMRFLRALLHEASARNQIIVTTHDPHFVDPQSIAGLRRVWWAPDSGTCVRSIGHAASEREAQQARTIFRHLGNRDMAFARCVIVVEDETHLEFLLAVAPTLGYQLDGHGVSVVSVDGESGYPPMWGVLTALGVPHIALKDKDWGDLVRYPAERFFSFGLEIEEYLDNHGLKGKREAVMREHGNSKRRAARPLELMLAKDEVPPIFDEILGTAVRLATGAPSTNS